MPVFLPPRIASVILRACRATALVVVLALAASAAPIGRSNEGQTSRPAPRNIIVMVGDGMGFNHVESARLYALGKTTGQVYDGFPVRIAMSTYPGSTSGKPLAVGEKPSATGYDPLATWAAFDHCKAGATDSAAAATTMACGVKTYNSSIGMDMVGRPLTSASEAAKLSGRAAGVVTSVPLSHATPAGFAAHNVNRGNYAEIADEMVTRSRLDVIMGGGHPLFDDKGGRAKLDKDSWNYVGGKAVWHELTSGKAGGDADGDGVPDPWRFIETRDQFQRLGRGAAPARVCGVFRSRSTLQQGRGGDAKADAFTVPFNPNVPTLAEMTRAAINVLDGNPRGFFLMVEGGAIDWAAHANQPGRVIEEQTDFNRAIEAVVAWVERNSNWDETLLVITADHETGYLWGPGSGAPATWNPLTNNGAGKQPGMQFNSTGHTNSLVPFFAKGAGSQEFVRRATRIDPRRGPFVDNADLGQVVKELAGSRASGRR